MFLSLQMNSSQTFDLSAENCNMYLGEGGVEPGELLHTASETMTNYNSPYAPRAGSEMYLNGQVIGYGVQDEKTALKVKCSNCQKFYTGKAPLVRHWKQMHGLQGGYCCQTCGWMFGQKSHLIRHYASCSHREKNNQLPGPDVWDPASSSISTPVLVPYSQTQSYSTQ